MQTRAQLIEFLGRPLTILLYGSTGAGKTTLIGELAKWLKVQYDLHTVYVSADTGGPDPIQNGIAYGYIDPIIYEGGDFWLWLHQVSLGLKPVGADHPKGATWVSATSEKTGLVAYDFLTSAAEGLETYIRRSWAEAPSQVGPEGVIVKKGSGIGAAAFVTQNKATGEHIASLDQSHIGMIQDRMVQEIRAAMQAVKVPILLWTAMDRVTLDKDASLKMTVGPAIIGRALTYSLPKDINKTIRIFREVKGTEAVHRLYLDMHIDPDTGNRAMANPRLPLGAKLAKTVVEPASLVEALTLYHAARMRAAEAERKELGL